MHIKQASKVPLISMRYVKYYVLFVGDKVFIFKHTMSVYKFKSTATFD